MGNVQYPVGQGASAQAALPAAHGIQPADELAAHGTQAAGGQVTQAVQRVVGKEALTAVEHVAQEIQPAAAQEFQQAVGQAQHGELEVECIYFCRLGIFFVLSFLFIFVCFCGAYIGNFIVVSGLGGFHMGDYMLLTWVVCIRAIFISGSVFFLFRIMKKTNGVRVHHEKDQ